MKGGTKSPMENTVPQLELPPFDAAPYRVLPAKSNPAYGLAPSLPLVKLYRVVKVCAVARPAGSKLRAAISTDRRQ